jgi:hypothetical protein
MNLTRTLFIPVIFVLFATYAHAQSDTALRRLDSSRIISLDTLRRRDSIYWSQQKLLYPWEKQPSKNPFGVSYTGKKTDSLSEKYAVGGNGFDKDSFYMLQSVTVFKRNYHADSLSNRQEYGDAYDYKKPKFSPLKMLASPASHLYDVLNVKEKRTKERLKNNLVNHEQEGYVDNRFTRSLVAKYTGEQNDSTLADFMYKYRPSYELLVNTSDLDLIVYIQNSFKEYKQSGGNKDPADRKNRQIQKPF